MSSTCPTLVLSTCRKESIRFRGGEENMCGASCDGIMDLHPGKDISQRKFIDSLAQKNFFSPGDSLSGIFQ